MELLNRDEIVSIVKSYNCEVITWSICNYSEKLLGYLGDHLKLKVEVKRDGVKSKLSFFVKCKPQEDTWKANYLKDLPFFKKEYVMLNNVFKHFDNNQDSNKWRPQLQFIREDVFVFEDVAEMGYVMPSNTSTFTYGEIIAAVRTLAKFHAQSYIYEERRTNDLGRPYRIWEDYSDYLQEPHCGYNHTWRSEGMNSAIDLLKTYSKYKSTPNFIERLESTFPILFDSAVELMKPSATYRNAIVHRDLWSNNIFFKSLENGLLHSLIVDFQTVIYCSPMLDLSSLLYFNTTIDFRNSNTNKIIDIYYDILTEELNAKGVEVATLFDKTTLMKMYQESVLFSITQAALIIPITTMPSALSEKLFFDGNKNNNKAPSRSEVLIERARTDDAYKRRNIELLEEIVDRFVDLQSSQ